MSKKILFYALSAIFLVTAGCNGVGVRGNGKIRTESRTIEDFERLEVQAAYDIDILCNNQPGISVTADDNLLKNIVTESDGNTLRIYNKKSIKTRKAIKIQIKVPKLKEISASGASRIDIKDLSAEAFRFESSGAVDFRGVGKVDRLEMELSGAVNARCENLKARKVSLDLSGACSARVYASEELDASISGVGDITYFGNPQKVHKNISGLGSIKESK